jgi:hypothetical protein
MMLRALFGIMALVPAAFNATPPHAAMLAQMLTLPLCEGGIAHGSVNAPLGQAPQPGTDRAGCCAKGCHGSRRRGAIDRAQ